MSYKHKLPDDEVNVTKHSALGDVTWMIGGLSAILMTLYFTLSALINYEVKMISIENEQKVFDYLNIAALFENNDSNNSTNYQNLLTGVQKCSKTPYKLKLIIADDNVSNAFALPGGIIIINQGLINQAQSQNELFFVLSHEVGHIQNRDHIEALGRGLLSLSILAILGLNDSNALLEYSLNFSESRFSQERESEADLYAVDMMACYYEHVQGATDFFKHDDHEESVNMLFSTHPQMKERIKNIEHYIVEKSYPLRGLAPLIRNQPAME